MSELEKIIGRIVADSIQKMIISKPQEKTNPYKKIVIERKKGYFQAAKYTEKQVFHDNIAIEALEQYLLETISDTYLQANAWDVQKEHILLLSKKGKVSYKVKQLPDARQGRKAQTPDDKAFKTDIAYEEHNRQKKYILKEGEIIPPLVDMGIFSKEGKVIKSMYDKFRQINRFIEMIDDGIRGYKKDEIHIIDFGCGKSYLTFIMYYYFTEVRHMKVQMLGLDLKADVIRKCNEAAEKYGYENLLFEMGDINGYKARLMWIWW